MNKTFEWSVTLFREDFHQLNFDLISSFENECNDYIYKCIKISKDQLVFILYTKKVMTHE